jgi:flagellar protein FlbD
MPPCWAIRRRSAMIELTRLNDKKFTLNSDLIETVEEVPDTSITLTNGKKIMVKESRIEVKNLVKEFKKEIFNQNNI